MQTNFILFTKRRLHRSLDLIIDYQFLPETTDMLGIAMQCAVTFRGRYRNAGSSFEMRSCTCSPVIFCATSFSFLSERVYMPKGIGFFPFLIPFPRYTVRGLLAHTPLTGLANDSYLVHRKIMKLREKETGHFTLDRVL